MKLNITPDPGNLNCRRCSKYNQPACTRCGFCTACCQCRMCSQCHTSHSARRLCLNCGMCKFIGCSCPIIPGGINIERTLVGTHRQQSPTHHPLSRVTKLDQTTRPVAVEVELSNYSPRESERFRFRHTQTHGVRDGSIRSDGNPIEFIVGPIPGLGFDAAMEELSRWLTVTGATANDSCGLHVHVDGRDLKAFEMRRLLELYKVLEERFYNLVAPTRRSAHYSKIYELSRWGDLLACRGRDKSSSQIREAILRGVYGPWENPYVSGSVEEASYTQQVLRDARRRATSKYDNARYYGFNLHSWFHRGTVEFRHMEGTVDPVRIRLWTLWCRWLVEIAAQLRDEEVREIRSVEDYLTGSWKRPGGMLGLPQELVLWARQPWVASPPAVTVTAPNGVPVMGPVPPDEVDVVQSLNEYRERVRRAARNTVPIPAPRIRLEPTPPSDAGSGGLRAVTQYMSPEYLHQSTTAAWNANTVIQSQNAPFRFRGTEPTSPPDLWDTHLSTSYHAEELI